MSEIRLFNQDCMEAMRDMPDKYYSLCICDPPYGINAPNMQMGNAPNRKGKEQYPNESWAVKLKKNRLQRLNGGGGKLKDRILNKSVITWDYEKPSPEYFKELFRISVNQIIWGGNYFGLPATRGIVCWDKVQPWENFSQWEMAWTSFDCPAAMFRFSNTGGNITKFKKKIHPTEKPIELYKYLLLKFAKPGDKILDTHGGSMSIALACHDLGYDLDLFEIDEDYFKAGKERLERHQRQQTLFKPEELRMG